MPTSQKQIDANRKNAQKSTGPKTEEGKIRSSMNGFKSHITGLTTIMADEDSAAREEFVAAYTAEWAPQGAIERQLARTLALDNWRLNRIKTVEENIFAYDLVMPKKIFTHERIEAENALGHAWTYIHRSREFDRISLYESRLNRIIAKNTELLQKRQAARKAEEKSKAPQQEPRFELKPVQHFTAQNGFAPANSRQAPEAPSPDLKKAA
jgi:hypothetical protein